MIEAAQVDRYESKKRFKGLKFGNGAPGTRDLQDRWIHRLDTFREHALKQDLSTAFTVQDLIRFFDGIIDNLESSIKDKTAVNRKTIMRGSEHVLDYGAFQYTDFKVTKQDHAKLKTFLHDACQEGRLTRDFAQKKVWISFMLLARMSAAWLNHYKRSGARCWDLIIN